jgi:iron(III) transport system ATP-binding protein
MVDMDMFSDSFPHTLSGGQQQRVALARALAPSPQIMLLDEPYSGLDARLRDSIRDQVLHLLKANNCATLMVTHDSEEAMFMADRIVVMRDGQVVQTGTPKELYCHPVNSFVASIFGELNFVTGTVTENGIISDLGTLPSNGIEVGKAVEIAIRPEALTIIDGIEKKDRQRAIVVESKLLGSTSFIHLSFPYPKKTEEKSKHLHARIPGVSLPKSGDIVGIDIDLTQTFIFETEKIT